MKILSIITLVMLMIFSQGAFSSESFPPLRTVGSVDLEKYQGLWYEIQRIENSFEKGCENVTALYKGIRGDKIRVTNTCFKKKSNGETKKTTAKGIAFVVDKETNARLKVSFVPFFQWLGFFAGDYNIIALDQDYNYALVGSQNREYLWILARSPKLTPETIESLKEVAKEQGFDVSKLITTPQI